MTSKHLWLAGDVSSRQHIQNENKQQDSQCQRCLSRPATFLKIHIGSWRSGRQACPLRALMSCRVKKNYIVKKGPGLWTQNNAAGSAVNFAWARSKANGVATAAICCLSLRGAQRKAQTSHTSSQPPRATLQTLKTHCPSLVTLACLFGAFWTRNATWRACGVGHKSLTCMSLPIMGASQTGHRMQLALHLSMSSTSEARLVRATLASCAALVLDLATPLVCFRSQAR